MNYWISGEPTSTERVLVSGIRTGLSEVRARADISEIETGNESQITTRLKAIGDRVDELADENATAQDLKVLNRIHEGVRGIASRYRSGHVEIKDATELSEELENVLQTAGSGNSVTATPGGVG